jgi:hypothetical protein
MRCSLSLIVKIRGISNVNSLYSVEYEEGVPVRFCFFSQQSKQLSSLTAGCAGGAKISGLISIMLSLAVIELGANVVQPGGINAIGLTVDGFDQFFGFEFLKTASVQSASRSPSRL